MSKQLTRSFLIAILAIIPVLFIIISNNQLWRAAFLESGGFVEVGSKFGIKVGDDLGSIDNKLGALGLKIDDVAKDNRCVSRQVKGDYAVYSYDKSWRRGVICIGISGRRVQSIAWSFSPFAP